MVKKVHRRSHNITPTLAAPARQGQFAGRNISSNTISDNQQTHRNKAFALLKASIGAIAGNIIGKHCLMYFTCNKYCPSLQLLPDVVAKWFLFEKKLHSRLFSSFNRKFQDNLLHPILEESECMLINTCVRKIQGSVFKKIFPDLNSFSARLSRVVTTASYMALLHYFRVSKYKDPQDLCKLQSFVDGHTIQVFSGFLGFGGAFEMGMNAFNSRKSKALALACVVHIAISTYVLHFAKDFSCPKS